LGTVEITISNLSDRKMAWGGVLMCGCFKITDMTQFWLSAVLDWKPKAHKTIFALSSKLLCLQIMITGTRTSQIPPLDLTVTLDVGTEYK